MAPLQKHFYLIVKVGNLEMVMNEGKILMEGSPEKLGG